ncbi:NACHT domain-containing NTPase, partial [Proteus vulgaris]
IVSEQDPLIITGEAGMGKSTLLKKIGEKLILENDNIDTRIIPVYISTLELFEAGLNVEKVVIEKISLFFKIDKIDDFLENYKLLILIDSIDEFEDSQKESIINYLKDINEKKKVRYIIASRSKEFTIGNTSLNEVKSYNISRFDNKQIAHFVQKFFLNEGGRAEKLLDAL